MVYSDPAIDVLLDERRSLLDAMPDIIEYIQSIEDQMDALDRTAFGDMGRALDMPFSYSSHIRLVVRL